jgi:hypothetical protein
VQVQIVEAQPPIPTFADGGGPKPTVPESFTQRICSKLIYCNCNADMTSNPIVLRWQSSAQANRFVQEGG